MLSRIIVNIGNIQGSIVTPKRKQNWDVFSSCYITTILNCTILSISSESFFKCAYDMTPKILETAFTLLKILKT
jgi:hypothetical protein